jgi:hypothetical protein
LLTSPAATNASTHDHLLIEKVSGRVAYAVMSFDHFGVGGLSIAS